jgi:hypothetical protein
MKLKKKSLYSALVACAIVAGYSAPASANVTISNWQLNLPGGLVISNINQLVFGGESYVTNTQTGTPGVFTSTDVGVFNILQYNNGNKLPLGNGQLTGTFTATDITNLSTGSYIFTGGTFNLYYNQTAAPYGTTAANDYGASSGTQIASFTISNTGNPSTGGGFIQANGQPTDNGTVTVTSEAPTTLTPSNVLLDSSGNALSLSGLVLGFVTTNASLDATANPNTVTNPGAYTIDPNLVSALNSMTTASYPGVTTGTYNVIPSSMFISNAGQLKLQYAPEPATIALLGCGLLGIGWSLRRKMGA